MVGEVAVAWALAASAQRLGEMAPPAEITTDGRVGERAGEFYPHVLARAGLAALEAADPR